MNRLRIVLAVCILLLLAGNARAHIGSPDVFFDGKLGPYSARITIRMPPVVPGRAEIDVRPIADRPVQVSILPLYSKIPVKNSPPPEAALAAPEEPGLYRGELWLMRPGGYSVEVRVRGEAGEGVVQIPVNSVATHQLPLPRFLALILTVLCGLLLIGLLLIVKAAAGESTVPPGAAVDQVHRRKGVAAMAIAVLVCAGAVAGGRWWWNAEEADFRRHLREGAWPDLTAELRTEGAQRILHLTLGDTAFPAHYTIPLLPDHGKLLHTFLIGERENGSVAHIHPVRQGGKVFEAALPRLPEGDYRIFVDLSLGDSGMSSTTSASIHLPPVPAEAASPGSLAIDPDDSWASCPAASVPRATDPVCAYHFEDGLHLVWKPRAALRVRRDAGFQFEVSDAAGQPVSLEPYMGMVSHAMVMRADGAVFAHLHPAGNFSMASQMFFTAKIAAEAGASGEVGTALAAGTDHTQMHHGSSPAPSGKSSFYLPYEFPSPGEYHIWVQFKTAGQVHTARFEATVPP